MGWSADCKHFCMLPNSVSLSRQNLQIGQYVGAQQSEHFQVVGGQAIIPCPPVRGHCNLQLPWHKVMTEIRSSIPGKAKCQKLGKGPVGTLGWQLKGFCPADRAQGKHLLGGAYPRRYHPPTHPCVCPCTDWPSPCQGLCQNAIIAKVAASIREWGI